MRARTLRADTRIRCGGVTLSWQGRSPYHVRRTHASITGIWPAVVGDTPPSLVHFALGADEVQWGSS